MTNQRLNNIPKDQTGALPPGVNEVTYPTEAEMTAFLAGLQYADDIDQYNGDAFERDGQWVVRFCVGDFDEAGADEADDELDAADE